MSTQQLSHRLEGVLLATGLLLLAIATHSEFESNTFQRTASAVLDSAQLAPGVLGRLEIPRLGISAMVAEGVSNRTLDDAIGHISTTPVPGSPGNCALAGHRDTFLRGLGSVRSDDDVRFVTPRKTYVYRVEWSRIVNPRHVAVLDPTEAPALTLVTCYPFESIGRAPMRFAVRARQVSVEDTGARAPAHAVARRPS